MFKKLSNKKAAIAMLCCGAALIAFPFMQTAMQGSISNGEMTKINAGALQIDSVSMFDGGGPSYSSGSGGGGSATTFRDMSSNIVSASSGFGSLNPFSGMFGGNSHLSQNTPVINVQDLQYNGNNNYYSQSQAADMQGNPNYHDTGRDAFPEFQENGIKAVRAEPVSTFSVDVDTASYGFVRRMINEGQLPQNDAVRIEELVNYFPYNYALPEKMEDPFKPTVAVYQCPWQHDHKLVHIGIKGYNIAHKPKSNFVFLIDTSGSMASSDKLPLVVRSLKLMLEDLSPGDTVGIVTYAGSAGVALEPTSVEEKDKILRVLDNLGAGGSTAGGEGIKAAYDLAEESLIKDGNNRVILATDGDFNVGISSADDLKSYIETRRDKGIFLSVLGYGTGNYQDTTMQALAQAGNGNASYISDLSEARKVLVEEASSTLFTIAKDVKIQVEFNPATVQEYRLIGYETRKLKREDFSNDKIDAGEIGAGHTVTAIYEITPTGVKPALEGTRYDHDGGAETVGPKVEDKSSFTGELAFLKIRYKQPDGVTSKLMTQAITKADEKSFDSLSDDVRFASAVAGFGQLLHHSAYTPGLKWQDVIEMANNARGKDDYGYRGEFVQLLRLAQKEEGPDKQNRYK